MSAELEVVEVVKADDLFACDAAGRPEIDCDGCSVSWESEDRTPKRNQKQQLFFHSVFLGNSANKSGY